MTTLQAWSLLMSFLGFGLCLFLSFVLFHQRRIAPAGLISWSMMCAFGAWHLLTFAEAFSAAALRVTLPLQNAAFLALAAALIASVMLLRLAIIYRKPGFLTALGITLILAALPLPLPLFTIAPPFIVAYYYHFHHTFGLQLGSRPVFALTLGVSTAVYLFAIRMLAQWLELKFQAVGWLIELVLLFWAGILWLPLYAALSRFLARRERIYAEFGRTVVQQASMIFDLDRRLQFFATEIEQRFRLARVIAVSGEIVAPEGAISASEAESFGAWLASGTKDIYWAPGMEENPVKHRLTALDFNYVLPLRYENRLSGFLLLDTRPLAFLEDQESVLTAIAPQISQSMESCRLLEEKIHLEKELVRQDHLAAVGKVAATIAHEVKNPLSAIKAIAQLMKEDETVTAAYAQDLGFIVEQVNRLDQSVRQLLGFSKPPASMEETVNLSELISATAAALQRQAQPLGVEIHAVIEPAIILQHTNRELLQQIVLNLILNAVQASPPQSQVEVRLTPNGVLHIADQGPGIPEQIRDKVFEPFFTTKTKGTGLGLAIVRRNARLLGGDVDLECPPSGGTAVTVRFTYRP